VSLCSESELKNMLGRNVHAPDNITHLGMLVALIKQRAIAQDLLVGVEKAISSLTMDGFDGEPFRLMLRETQQASPGVLALELSNDDLDECSTSVEESDDDMSSFISGGGESGLGAARTLISQGNVRNYRAFSNMGYDRVNDATSRKGTSPRGKSAKIGFQARPPQKTTARSPNTSTSEITTI
jgi:hypothetical protein